MLAFAKTDVGKVRANNEDAFYLPPNEDDVSKLFIVADGMGGHLGGEVASQMAIDIISSYINSRYSSNLKSEQIKELLNEALAQANDKILNMAVNNAKLSGMGTTITMALFKDDVCFIGHVGDSRAYILRNNEIKQLTKDHSYVRQLVDEGKITLEDSKDHPLKNVITKAVGTDKVLEPDIFEVDLKKNDIILLCSDGLTNMLDDKTIQKIVAENPCNAVHRLIEEAKLNGGPDNITVEIIIAN